MATVKKLVLIEYTPQQMFDLVDRVEEYPKFLPWCGGTELLDRTELITRARLHINYHGIKSDFSTENDKVYPTHMLIKLVEGPFHHLEGTWDFTPLGDRACKVDFTLHYEFSSKLIEKAVGPVFSHIANTFVDSFVKRAEQVYLRSN
ncbi:MAG TPA: type II toxin-antitoxin system RatA family toxin [Rhodocyclaceae bacterium]|nr:type II toxin-antitoxin system RatA family toxin [Rhodocyclaceae bacterium]HMV54518.1 type II toxin-antitoxin system RatA family toxin [Rhodocyclaceae bacterium]HMZ84958.1 type II toxin-antitoxin system RatA family toxin [Rhodocyclaceae bacterium]HNB79914.1 type II toxin-antitoxin system RatA family toxin [Rhodocyclaceae bacterium]HNC62306.1 type II toxin-antitoxin system RatA family toxin [Rhodocyclaceae bacterium]